MLKKYLIKSLERKATVGYSPSKKKALISVALGGVILVSFLVLSGWAVWNIGNDAFQEVSQIVSGSWNTGTSSEKESEGLLPISIASRLAACWGRVESLLSFETLLGRPWVETFHSLVGSCWSGEVKQKECQGTECIQAQRESFLDRI